MAEGVSRLKVPACIPKASLRSRGSDLLVRLGQPDLVLPALVQELRQVAAGQVAAVEVRWSDESGEDEAALTTRVRAGLAAVGGCSCWAGFSGSLFHPDDLPTAEAGWRCAGLPLCRLTAAVARSADAVSRDTRTITNTVFANRAPLGHAGSTLSTIVLMRRATWTILAVRNALMPGQTFRE